MGWYGTGGVVQDVCVQVHVNWLKLNERKKRTVSLTPSSVASQKRREGRGKRGTDFCTYISRM